MQNVSRYEDTVICTSNACARVLHTTCTKITESELTNLKVSGEIGIWKCNICETNSNPEASMSNKTTKEQVTPKIAPNVGTCNTIDDIISTKVKYALNYFTEEIITVLRNEVHKLVTHTSTLNAEICNFKCEINNLKDENINLKGEVINLKQVLSSLLADGNSFVQNAAKQNLHLATSEEQFRNNKKLFNKIETPKTINKDTPRNNTHGQKMDTTIKGMNYANSLRKPTAGTSPALNINRKNPSSSDNTTAIGINDNVGFETVKKLTVQHSKDNTREDNNINDNVYQIVSRKRRRSDSGTIGIAPAENTFSGIPKQAWLYIGRVNKGVETGDVQNYFKKKFPDINFTLENLNSKGSFASFKLGFDLTHLETVNRAEMWPAGTLIRRYRFSFFGKTGNRKEADLTMV